MKGMEWEPPNVLQLTENRIEFKSMFGYANDFLSKVDLFDDKLKDAEKFGGRHNRAPDE